MTLTPIETEVFFDELTLCQVSYNFNREATSGKMRNFVYRSLYLKIAEIFCLEVRTNERNCM